MTIKATLNINLVDQVKQLVKRAEKHLDKAASDHLAICRENAQDGKDFEGKAFEKYKPAYAKRREKAGRRGHPPNLTVTGNMLNAMQQKAERLPNGDYQVTHYVLNTSSKAPAALGGGTATAPDKMRNSFRLGRRPFGLNKQQGESIAKYVITRTEKSV